MSPHGDTIRMLLASGPRIARHLIELTGVSQPTQSPAMAYDMTPMAFAPRSGGGLPDSLPEARRDAAHLARLFLDRI